MIQDYIMSVIQIVFILALLPTVFGKNFPNFWTSLLTGVGLFILAGCMFTLDALLTGLFISISAVLWIIIAVRSEIAKDN